MTKTNEEQLLAKPSKRKRKDKKSFKTRLASIIDYVWTDLGLVSTFYYSSDYSSGIYELYDKRTVRKSRL